MKKTTVFLFLAAISFASSAQVFADSQQQCRDLLPQDYLVYSLGNIRATESDFQGVTGAYGSVSFRTFQIKPQAPQYCVGLVAGQTAMYIEGQVAQSGIDAGADVIVRDSTIEGKIRYGKDLYRTNGSLMETENATSNNVQALAETSQFFMDRSLEMSQFAVNGQTTFRGGILTFTASDDISVFQITAAQLNAALVVQFRGSSRVRFIVNVIGDDAAITNKDIQVRGGFNVGQVIMNFPHTKRLLIQYSGNNQNGIPVTVLAPYAAVQFNHALITGGLYVGSIEGTHGQVNYAPTPWICTDSECTGGKPGKGKGDGSKPHAPAPAPVPAPGQAPRPPVFNFN